jgi:hypothetical protein
MGLTLIFPACTCTRLLKTLYQLNEIRLFLDMVRESWLDGGLVEETEISNINFETLGIHFLGSYMGEVLQNMMAGRTNGAVQYNTWVKLVESKLTELSKYPVWL